ncbi:M36 family metallopeptidase [Nocardioides vastitatis]|uniref:M36 family metallopeptidase n=1 Tax=Nocardioides vastitatis TaxID=2568655 RepID=A0ABW0ZKP1_9ACTN
MSACTALAVTFSVAPSTQANPVPAAVTIGGDQEHQYTDVRDSLSVRPTRAQLDAVSDIVRAAADGARVTYDDRFGTPRTIYPNAGTLSEARSGEAVDVARGWLAENRAALGLTSDDIASLVSTRDHVLGTGTHVIGFRQTFGGVEAVHGGSMTVVVREDGAVESYAGQTVRSTELTGDWSLSAARALEGVASDLAGATGFTATAEGSTGGYTTFAKGPFAAGSYVKKTVFVTADAARPAYQVLFVEKLDEAYDVLVDARSGEVLRSASLVAHSDSEGTVYENFPGDEGAGGSPVVKSFGPNEQSPSGYVDPTGLAGAPGPTTFGNNASTYANWSNFLVPADQAPRPVSPVSHFNYAFGNAWEKQQCAAVPPSYAEDVNPAATNLFYHHNRIHDEFYRLGFTESGDNFQVNNGAGVDGGGDPILGLVQAGAATGGAPLYTGRDNAYMLTLPDGIPPWSGMFLWEPINDAFEGPCRDGDFDAGVIEHEYAHGLSNRYVSEEDNALNVHQSGSMGEGWGDWYALNYLHREGLDTGSVVGEYVTGNSQRGIRNWAYDANPTTFGDVGYDLTGPEVHADGEIWTTILWDYRKALVAAFGEAKGSSIAEHTVTDAMPRSPSDPSFIDMRNAIELAIDDRYHDSADYERIVDIFWTEFAQRGLGAQAQTKGGSDVDPVPAFDHKGESRNGTFTGRVVNASTGAPVKGAKVILGRFEGRVTGLRTTSATGAFSAPVVGGTYPVTIQARGFGAQTFPNVTVAPGRTTSLQFSLAPNLVSEANGAKVVKSTAGDPRALLDDTEASSWKTGRRGNVVIDMGRTAKVDAIQVSAYTTSRFEGLKDFTMQVSTDGKLWSNAVVKKGAFTYLTPRPVAPDLHYKTFELANRVSARYVRFWADAPQGETKENVQVAELQVFSGSVKNVVPLPPPPPDAPVTDTGTITAGTPGGDKTGGGVTAVDFATNCVMPPATQGSDGWVTELPSSFGDGVHTVKVTGASAAPWDLDVYFYAEDCTLTGSAASSAADESGTIPSGTKYVLSHLWSGADVDVTVLAEDTQ